MQAATIKTKAHILSIYLPAKVFFLTFLLLINLPEAQLVNTLYEVRASVTG